MQLVFVGSLLLAAFLSVSSSDECSTPQEQRICRLEAAVAVLENAVQELLDRTDINLNEPSMMAPQKRKNEFIRFGKRSEHNDEKRKNEFIRFGKRKNEFIRFG